MSEIVYKLEVFEGPLDLLLSLISKNKMDIMNIQISEICDQYMEYINQAQKLDLDLAGEFLVMAAELMLIKSKSLLPKQDGPDPKVELIMKIMEYTLAKEAAKDLGEKESIFKGRFEKDTDELKPIISEDFRIDKEKLVKALHGVYARLEEEQRLNTRKKTVVPLVQRKMKTMKEACSDLVLLIKEKKELNFYEVFSESKNKEDILSTFCALLELLKYRKIIMERQEDEITEGYNLTFRFNEETDDNFEIIDYMD